MSPFRRKKRPVASFEEAWTTPRPAQRTLQGPACNVCRGPATRMKRWAPWPGTPYAHTSYACDAHLSFFDNHIWVHHQDGTITDGGPADIRCSNSGLPADECQCPTSLRNRAWEAQAIVSDL